MTRSISYSEYSMAAQCLRKYKLIVIDKLHTDAPPSGDMAFGSALHSAVNSAITGGDAFAIFDIYWKSEKDKNNSYGRFDWEALYGIGKSFLDKFIKRYAEHLKPTVAERRLKADYKGLTFEGTPDFVGEYKGVTALLDWKTAAYNYDQRKADIALQLNLYAYLSIKELGITPKLLGYFVFNKGTGGIQNPLLWAFDSDKMYSMLDDMVEYCKDLNTRENFPKNPNACIQGTQVCQFFNSCWKGKK